MADLSNATPVTAPGREGWQPIETARKGARVEGLSARKEIISGRIPPRDGKVRDTNVVIDAQGFRHVCTHWRPADPQAAAKGEG